VHVCGKIYFIGTFKFFIGTFNFIYCRNRKNQNHATSRLRKNLAVPYRKNKQKLQPTSTDAVVEIFTPITTKGPAIYDYNERLILLSVIQLSGEQCGTKNQIILF